MVLEKELPTLDRMRDHLIIHLILWVLLSILLPLLPIGLGITISALKQIEISVFEILNGIELLLISLGLVTATGIELWRSNIDWSSRILLRFFVGLLLVVLGIFNVILLTLIYIEVNDPDLQFDSGTKFTFIQILLLATILLTISLQLYIGIVRYNRSVEDNKQ